MSTIVVGLNMGHDAGVSMLVDGQVIFAANEERFSRKKNHVGFPVLALSFLIENFHPKVDFVAVEGLKVLPLQVSNREANMKWNYRGCRPIYSTPSGSQNIFGVLN